MKTPREINKAFNDFLIEKSKENNNIVHKTNSKYQVSPSGDRND